MARLRDLPQLVSERVKDGGTPASGTEDDLEASSLRDDEGARLVVEGVAVRVWAHLLGLSRVVAWLASTRRTVLTGTAVLRFVVFGAARQTGVEVWPPDVVVWVGIDAISRFLRGVQLQGPRTPGLGEADGDGLFEWKREGCVGAELGVGSVANWGQEGGCADADGVC